MFGASKKLLASSATVPAATQRSSQGEIHVGGETAQEASAAPSPLEGVVWKKSPKMLAALYQKRNVSVAEGKLRYESGKGEVQTVEVSASQPRTHAHTRTPLLRPPADQRLHASQGRRHRRCDGHRHRAARVLLQGEAGQGVRLPRRDVHAVLVLGEGASAARRVVSASSAVDNNNMSAVDAALGVSPHSHGRRCG